MAAALYGVVRHRRDLVDFDVYRTAGERALAAEPLYRPEDGHYQFKYLPAFALAMAPFAEINPEVAKAVWFALSVGLLVVFVRASVRGLPGRRLAERSLTWLTVLCLAKFYVHELALGQTNIVLAALLFAAVFTIRDQPLLSGALVGLGVFIKPYAIVLVPWLVLALGPLTLLASGSVLVAGLALPAAAYGWHGNLELLASWYRTVTDTTGPNLLLPENISLATMWAKWLGPGRAASTLALASAAVLLGLVAGVIRARRRVGAPNYLEFGLLLLLVPLLSPQGWDYVLLLATPAVVCVVDRWREMTALWRVATLAAIGLMSFTIFDVLGRALYARLMALSVVSVGALVLAASLAELRRRSLA